jgi:Luciferase-like monooxygenase
MKVRIGISLGPGGTPDGFAASVDLLEQAGVDSLWLPETVYGSLVDPFTGMAFALSRTARLKAGSGVSVLPGRHPVLVAKQLASLAGLAPARVLPVFGLRPAREDERVLFPVPAGQRAAVFDESLVLLRMLLTSENVSFDGEFHQVRDASIGPLPGRPIREAAAGAGREVEEDHFGLSLAIAFGAIPDALATAIGRRRPGVDPETLVAAGWDGARRRISQYAEAGLSKFVVRPVTANSAGGRDGFREFEAFVAGFVRELMPLQTR